MQMPSLSHAHGGLRGGVAVTFTNVWIIADDATPPSDALLVLAARGH